MKNVIVALLLLVMVMATSLVTFADEQSLYNSISVIYPKVGRQAIVSNSEEFVLSLRVDAPMAFEVKISRAVHIEEPLLPSNYLGSRVSLERIAYQEAYYRLVLAKDQLLAGAYQEDKQEALLLERINKDINRYRQEEVFSEDIHHEEGDFSYYEWIMPPLVDGEYMLIFTSHEDGAQRIIPFQMKTESEIVKEIVFTLPYKMDKILSLKK